MFNGGTRRLTGRHKIHRSLLAQGAEKEAGSGSVNFLVWMEVILVPLMAGVLCLYRFCSSCQFENTSFLSANANTAHAQMPRRL